MVEEFDGSSVKIIKIMASNVRAYTDSELMTRVKSLPSFNGIPNNFWLLAVRSAEDAFNRFDDKFYLFKGETCFGVWKGTTNAGTDLLNPTNPRGEAVLKSNEIYYDSHERRLHRRRVLAYCQRIPLPIYRDNDKDKNIEEIGTPKLENVGINIHPASYQIGTTWERETIQGWSQGCFVLSVRADFDTLMAKTKGQQRLTLCVLREF